MSNVPAYPKDPLPFPAAATVAEGASAAERSEGPPSVSGTGPTVEADPQESQAAELTLATLVKRHPVTTLAVVGLIGLVAGYMVPTRHQHWWD